MSRIKITRSTYGQHINNIQNSRLSQLRSSSIELKRGATPDMKVLENVQPELTARRIIKPDKYFPKSSDRDTNIGLYNLKMTPEDTSEVHRKLQQSKEDRIKPFAMNRAWASYGDRDFNTAQQSSVGISMKSNSYVPTSAYKDISEFYNPNLPDSLTNIRPKDLPQVTDDRIEQVRATHEFLYESDQAQLNLNAKNNPDRLERLKRQEEAYKAYYKEIGMNRWLNDDRKEYLKYNDPETYLEDPNRLTRASSEQVSAPRETFNPYEYNLSEVNRTIEARKKFDETKLANNMYKELLKKARKETFKETSKDTFLDIVKDKLKSILGLKDKQTIKQTHRTFHDSPEAFESLLSDVSSMLDQRDTNHARLVLIRDFDRPIVTTDREDFASSLVTFNDNLEGISEGIHKTTMHIQDDKLIVVRQTIKGINEDPAADVTVIPIEHLDKSFRMRLEELNPMFNTRAQTLNMTYDDMKSIVQYINENPDVQQRLSLKQAYEVVRSLDYDDFESSNNIFLESNGKQKLSDTIRKHIVDKQRGRTVKDSEEVNYNNTSAPTFKNRAQVDYRVTERAGYIKDFKGSKYENI